MNSVFLITFVYIVFLQVFHFNKISMILDKAYNISLFILRDQNNVNIFMNPKL